VPEGTIQGCASVMAPSHRGARWQLLLLSVGLGLFGLLIYAAGPTGVLQTFGYLGWLTPVVVLPYLTSYALDTLGWWWVLTRAFGGRTDPPAQRVSIGHLFALRAAGEVVNAVTPTAYFGGEPVKAWLLNRQGVPLSRGLASVLVSKTALMLTQGLFVLLGLLVALGRWHTVVPMWAAATVGTALALAVAAILIRVQRRGLFTLLLTLSRRVTGREALLASWEAEVTALDGLLREFYDKRPGDFLVCCILHFLAWIAGCFEVFLTLRLLNASVDFPAALSIEALSGVAKLAALVVPGSLGVQEGGQVLIFAAFGLGTPLAMTFSLLRRGRELLWIGFGMIVLLHHQALRYMREGKGKQEK
jgi:glycosyltransferase 2 family protein